MCIHCMQAWCPVARRECRPLELELQVVPNHHMSAGNQTQASTRAAGVLNHSSIPDIFVNLLSDKFIFYYWFFCLHIQLHPIQNLRLIFHVVLF